VTDRLLLPAFVALWASGYVVGAAAIEVADPLPLLAVRFVLAAAILIPLAVRRGRWRGAPLGRLAVLGVLLHVVQFGGIYGGFALGVPAALSALAMLGLSPARHDRPGGGERPGARGFAALDRAVRRPGRRGDQPRARARDRRRRRRRCADAARDAGPRR
jgi:drug/metabolite transporter (DMT)-like permease